jgi:hypothetical protein
MTGRYEIIKIESTREGEVAYLLDTERGVVVVAPVEWMGQVEVEERPRPVRRALPVRTLRPREHTNIHEEEMEEEDPRDAIELPDPRKVSPAAKESLKGMRAKDMPGNSIIPPELRRTFKKGEDIIEREV